VMDGCEAGDSAAHDDDAAAHSDLRCGWGIFVAMRSAIIRINV
jgi:hypothetical protein